MKVSTRKKTKPVVDLSAMLDVIFQLILFFLVSTTFNLLPAINVNLPKSSTSSGAESSGITISIEENGTLWFNDENVSEKELSTLLSKFDTKEIERKNFPVLISADENVKNGKIVALFDIIRMSGFASVSLRTSGKK
ncbi:MULTISPECIES: ExbD/TolR family protein [unclassified Treponema]|uniref:ExbD/TolR family protein n=1 Tax=unclassified Treponema TaxID=2638727 RepID=UPI000E8D72C0|nr:MULTISPECIES: biopolymer transporter ExbD [unclassified Treponema]HBP10083.1 biopolymer transporter ExbD [Treponema sp.]